MSVNKCDLLWVTATNSGQKYSRLAKMARVEVIAEMCKVTDMTQVKGDQNEMSEQK